MPTASFPAGPVASEPPRAVCHLCGLLPAWEDEREHYDWEHSVTTYLACKDLVARGLCPAQPRGWWCAACNQTFGFDVDEPDHYADAHGDLTLQMDRDLNGREAGR